MTQTRRSGAAAVAQWLTRHPVILPGIILITAALFRLYNINWDDGQQLHPDERGIYMLVSGAAGHPPLAWPTSLSQFFNVQSSPLNPHYFAYGSLPYYILALLAGTTSFLGQHLPGLGSWATLDTYSNLPFLGRPLSAILDLSALVVLFAIARRIFGYWTAILTLALASWTVLDIQLSHFYQVDTVLLPLAMLVLLAAVIIAQRNPRSAYLWGGAALGAALASKSTAILLVVPLGLAACLGPIEARPFPAEGSWSERLTRHYRQIARELNGNLQWLLAAYLMSAAVFALCDPYAILDRQTLLADFAAQQTYLVTNNPPFEVPYTIQYAGTIPYLYQVKNLLFWCMGIPLGLATFAGTLFYVCRNLGWRWQRDQIVVLAWIIPYFLFVGRFFAKFNRYMLPIESPMIMFGAAFLVWLVARYRGRLRWPFAAAIGAVAAGSLVYALAYMNIYTHDNTRVAASRWIYTHVSPRTTIAVEGPWDETLPLGVDGQSGAQYQTITFDPYSADDQTKIATLTHVLTHAQYIVMSSERAVRSVPKLPDRFPITNRYYDLLLANRLNFRLVKHFQQHPELGPFTVHDYSADESFHVYDHPDVRIYRRVSSLSPRSIAALLTGGHPVVASPGGAPVIDTRLTLSRSQWAKDQKGPTMAEMFPPSGFGMQHPILTWVLVLELLGLLALPFTLLLFANLPDAAVVVSKTLGILILSYLVWMAVRVGGAVYDSGTIVALLGLLLIASALTAYFGRLWMWEALRSRARLMLTGEAVFLVSFAAFVLLRMWYPDLGHQFSPVSSANPGQGRMGEKQMELAFLNAIVRSRTFPPFDPFFAHGYINYYYYGFYLVANLCRLTGIAPSTGFNLAIPTFFALLTGTVFSVVFALTRRRVIAILGAVFVGVFGNLNGAWQLITGLMSVATVHSSAPLVGGIADVLSGTWQAVVNRQLLPPFDYWSPTRIVPPVQGPITEFPYFTYLFADLHPHLIAYPMTAAVLAMAVSLALPRHSISGMQMVVTTVMGGVLLGAIAVTNPWDFPTYVVVLGIGWLVGLFAQHRRIDVQTFVRAAPTLVLPVALSIMLYAPFKHDYQTVFATGIGLVRDISPTMLQNNGLCSSGQTNCPRLIHDTLVTPLHIYLEHFGFFAFVLMTYLLLLLVFPALGRERIARAGTRLQFLWYYRDRLPAVYAAMRRARKMTQPAPPVVDYSLLLGFAILSMGLALFGDYLLATLTFALGLVVLILLRLGKDLSRADLFVLAIVIVPLALSIGTQIFFIKDWLAAGAEFRMNTIFKFYNEIWVLFAVCSAVALARIGDTWREYATVRRVSRWHAGSHPYHHREPVAVSAARAQFTFADLNPVLLFQRHTAASPGGSPEVVASGSGSISVTPQSRSRVSSRFLSSLQVSWKTGLVLLAAASLIYTYAGTVARETYRSTWLPERSVPFTLDGMAFMKVAYPSEYQAISWLNSHVHGAPIIAEAAHGYYDWRSRVSMFTGLPTISNGIHEGEQRYGDELDAPTQDLDTLYNTASVTRAEQILRTYGIQYIYVGFSERQCVPQYQCFARSGLAKFPRMVGHGLRVAYRNAGVTIYQVERA